MGKWKLPEHRRSSVHWWDRMNLRQQQEYKREHPESRFVVGKYAKDCKKPKRTN